MTGSAIVVTIVMKKGWDIMKPIVEFCQSNLAAGTDKVMKKLEEEGLVDVVEYGCMGFCGECYESPYALVNGTIVLGDSPKDLLHKIREEIKDEV